VYHNPRQILLPLVAVQVPVAILTAAATIVLYLTVFSDRAEVLSPGALSGSDRDQLFASAILAAIEGLFTLVARGASIVAIAGAARGTRVPLTAALDPAFTRLGGLIIIIAVSAVVGVIAALTIVGLPVAIFAAIRVALVFDVYMLESLGPWAAFRRSWTLTRGSMIRLLGVVLLGAAVALPAVITLSLISAARLDNHEAEVLLVAGGTLVQSVLLIPVVAFVTATTTMFYLRLKANDDARPTA